VKRGEIWTVSGGNNYADKPRPAAIIQEDSFDGTSSVPKSRLGKRLGQLDDTDQLRVNRALMVFLGLARSAATRN
jgi:mRNA interferase MazF